MPYTAGRVVLCGSCVFLVCFALEKVLQILNGTRRDFDEAPLHLEVRTERRGTSL